VLTAAIPINLRLDRAHDGDPDAELSLSDPHLTAPADAVQLPSRRKRRSRSPPMNERPGGAHRFRWALPADIIWRTGRGLQQQTGDNRRGLNTSPNSCHGMIMSKLTDFYRDEAPDDEQRMLSRMWQWSDEDLEITHDFIQWMFPLAERSQHHPDAPVILPMEIAVFRADERIQENLRRSYKRILSFFGLAASDVGEVVEGPNFEERVPDVWAAPNHNWLRITRILRSSRLLGLAIEAAGLFNRLEAIYSSRRFPITAETFQYWMQAMHEE